MVQNFPVNTTMASHEERDHVSPVAATAADEGYAVDGELDPELNTDFQVDPAYTSSKQFKEQAEAGKKERKDGLHNVKSALVISGLVIAVIGAICSIARKMRDA